jgi:hypothetical protein
MIGCELSEFLSDPNCWDKIIEISYKIWEKEMPDQFIHKLFLEYDRKLENEQREERKETKENKKFNDSFEVISPASRLNPLGS